VQLHVHGHLVGSSAHESGKCCALWQLLAGVTPGVVSMALCTAVPHNGAELCESLRAVAPH
jgi:hypothetical protein